MGVALSHFSGDGIYPSVKIGAIANVMIKNRRHYVGTRSFRNGAHVKFNYN
jgi:hypothetical protein